jgi:hypothetical protein
MRCLPLLLALAFVLDTALAGDYDFDLEIPEAEKKPYTLGGRLEARYIYHLHDKDAARYKLNAVANDKDPGVDTHEGQALAELSATYRQEMFQAGLLTHHQYNFVDQTKDEWDNVLYEGYLSLTPTPQLTVDGGKKRVLWGKGYAWNPAGFINRPKDPDDPALSLNGRTLLGADLIKSFPTNAQGLTNLGLTALLLPVVEDWANEDLGDTGGLNTAIKLYLLWCDTDIDLIYFDGPEQPTSLGLDFAKNLAENIEVHGEAAWRWQADRVVLSADGQVRRSEEDQFSMLLGLRYLNALDTTFITEYYHNGAGYDEGELDDFFDYQASVGDTDAVQRANKTTRNYYRQRNFGRDYAYLKISQKEPFGILYLTPWAAFMANLHDGSFNLQPGVTWTPITNLELNLRVGIPVGPRGAEYGEKADAFRPEVWGRYFF